MPCSTAGSSTATPRELVVRTEDPAGLNSELVTAGVRILELTPVRPSLEEIVLAATESARRASGDPGRAPEHAAPPAHVGDHRRAERPAHPGGDPAGGHRPRPASGHRSPVPLGGADRRDAVPARRPRASCCRSSCRSRWRSSGGDAIAGEAQAGTLRYLLVRPVARGRLLVAKLASIVDVRRAGRAGRRARGLRRGPAAARRRTDDRGHEHLRHHPDPDADVRAHRPGLRLRRARHAGRRRHRAVPLARSPTRRSPPPWARSASWSPRRCCSASTRPTRCVPTC